MLAAIAGGLRSAHVVAFDGYVGSQRDVFLLDLSVGRRFNVSHSPGDEYAPAWNSIGSRLVYRETLNYRREALHALDMNTFASAVAVVGIAREDGIVRAGWTDQKEPHAFNLGYGEMWVGSAGESISPIGYGFNPSLSPDGQWVLYYADSPGDLNADVFAYDPVSRRTVNISQSQAHDWNPAWSPDGSQIAFISSRDGNAELYVVPFACIERRTCAQDIRRLTQTQESELNPTWSPNGQQIAFVRDQGDATQLFIIDVQTGLTQQVTWDSISKRAPAWMP
ncbi:MAG: DPP IV N-terminal domain-containing protein [Anaerolineae bacterium]